MVHEAWVGPDGNLLFITVDGPWDLNMMDGPNVAYSHFGAELL